MKHFAIDKDNNITLHASRKAARETGAGVFSTEEQFADLIGNDNKRLLDIWNSLPGVKPVTKFTSRKVATERIWKAIQNLEGGAAPQPEPAPESAPSPAISDSPVPAANRQPDSEPALSEAMGSSVVPVEAAPIDEPATGVGAQAANVAPAKGKTTKKAGPSKKARTGEPNANVPREGSKTSQVIAMLKRKGGATLEEIMAAMGWQQHTTRSMMSAGGSLAKKHGLVVTSEKVGDKRTYFIKA